MFFSQRLCASTESHSHNNTRRNIKHTFDPTIITKRIVPLNTHCHNLGVKERTQLCIVCSIKTCHIYVFIQSPLLMMLFSPITTEKKFAPKVKRSTNEQPVIMTFIPGTLKIDWYGSPVRECVCVCVCIILYTYNNNMIILCL